MRPNTGPDRRKKRAGNPRDKWPTGMVGPNGMSRARRESRGRDEGRGSHKGDRQRKPNNFIIHAGMQAIGGAASGRSARETGTIAACGEERTPSEPKHQYGEERPSLARRRRKEDRGASPTRRFGYKVRKIISVAAELALQKPMLAVRHHGEQVLVCEEVCQERH
jgi:hypothetical protein